VDRPVELPAPAHDGKVYVTTNQAADAMDVSATTIGMWRNKGYLSPHPLSPPGRPMYAWDDVVEAEHTAWQRGLETSGVDVRELRASRAAQSVTRSELVPA
jgi:hypothetical protein